MEYSKLWCCYSGLMDGAGVLVKKPCAVDRLKKARDLVVFFISFKVMDVLFLHINISILFGKKRLGTCHWKVFHFFGRIMKGLQYHATVIFMCLFVTVVGCIGGGTLEN
jgi:hypothetical protein